MGSLMGGWNSPVLKSKTDVYKRNRSLTKEDIEAYWRAQKKSDHSMITQETSKVDGSGRKFQQSNSFPVADSVTIGTSTHKIINKNDWWTMSSSAFLNEPPIPEGASNSYSSQFHIAKWAQKPSASDEIST